MSRREQRFHDFASYEYNGQIVMSPLDFVESITENQPKSKFLLYTTNINTGNTNNKGKEC